MENLADVFIKKFNEIEEAHLAVKNIVESFTEKGEALDDKLDKELDFFLDWWVEHGCIIGEMVENLTENEKKEHRDFTLNSRLAKILQESPFFWRIVNRPEGYPGDAEMMNIIYRNGFEGETPFGRFANRGAGRSQICQAVRNRRKFLYNEILKTGEGKVLSLAAGPAKEMYDVLSEPYKSSNYEFLALDHDIKTLRNASCNGDNSGLKYGLANAFRIIKNDFRIALPKKDCIYKCEPKKDFIENTDKIFEKYDFDELEKNSYDLVYTAGLYDYIETFADNNDKGTLALTANLFKLVKPGGTLIVGNMGPDILGSDLFSMEYLQNWLIIKRNEAEMFEMANAIPEQEISSINVLKEDEKVNYFLRIEKN